MDVPTGIVVAGSAIASKDVLLKVLGPTADYLGGELKNLVQRANINLSDVFLASLRKGAEQATGSVDARTAKAIIDDAAYCEDDLVKDYYGGVLCGAKSEGVDDAAIPYISILKGMSRLQVKTHFLIYAILHKRLPGNISSITIEEERSKARLIIDLDPYFKFVEAKREDWEAIIPQVVGGLHRAGLIGDFYRYGEPKYVNRGFPELGVTTQSLVVCPTILGAELFLWAAGISNPNPNLIIENKLDLLSRYPEKYRNVV